MSKATDAWEDEWSTVADTPAPSQQVEAESKKASSKPSKAQRRAQQAEFNRQFWAEAEGPSQPNYFLESRNVVPLRQEFKPPTVLLSRKGPIVQSRPTSNSNSHTNSNPPTEALQNFSIVSRQESSEDEEDTPEARQAALQQRQAQAAKDREEKQRKYEERRLELFGPQVQSHHQRPNSRSGNSSPGSNTPPHSRSSTPSSRGAGGRRGRGGRGGAGAGSALTTATHNNPQFQQQQAQIQQRNHQQQQIQQQQFRELYDPSYVARPDSATNQRENFQSGSNNSSSSTLPIQQPLRAPRGPDGSGRGGFGFANRGGKSLAGSQIADDTAPTLTELS